MEVGEKVTFPFAQGQMEGVIKRITGKTIYIMADFPRHKGKVIKRSIHDFEKGAKKKTPRSKSKSKKTE
jgi:hypothetical protein